MSSTRGKPEIMRIALALTAALVLVASACGSDESDGSNGGKCLQGATRACLGPGACEGAQSCDASGKWTACDCGGGGAGGSSGATGGGGGNDGSAGSPTGGNGGSSDSGAAGGSSGSGGNAIDSGSDAADSGPGPNDDPCPTQQLYSDCSGQCGGKYGCSFGPPMACTGVPTVYFGISGHHITFRTLEKPGQAQPCFCPYPFELPTAGGVAVEYTGSVIGARIRAGKPWKVRVFQKGVSTASQCLTTDFASGCAKPLAGVKDAIFVVATDDPNAPARNVIIDEGDCAPSDFWQ